MCLLINGLLKRRRAVKLGTQVRRNHAAQFGWVLKLVLYLAEDQAQRLQ